MIEDSMNYVDKLLRQAVIRGFEEINKRLDRSFDQVERLIKRFDDEVAQPQPVEVAEPVKTDNHGTLEG
jgi:hypothetical protein